MNQRHVLIIEDDPAVANATRRMLSKSGFDVLVCENGEDGELKVAGNPGFYEAALIDYTLPGSNGVEVSQRLKALDSNLQCVLMSGYPPEAIPVDLSDYQLSGFIQKPFITAELVAAIRKSLGITAPAAI